MKRPQKYKSQKKKQRIPQYLKIIIVLLFLLFAALLGWIFFSKRKAKNLNSSKVPLNDNRQEISQSNEKDKGGNSDLKKKEKQDNKKTSGNITESLSEIKQKIEEALREHRKYEKLVQENDFLKDHGEIDEFKSFKNKFSSLLYKLKKDENVNLRNLEDELEFFKQICRAFDKKVEKRHQNEKT